MAALLKTPPAMTVAEFLAWNAPPNERWQLVDGEPQAMAPASRTHNTILGRLGQLMGVHFDERHSPCTVVPSAGILPRARSNDNYRIPDLAVTYSGYETEEYALSEPVLLVEILSPSNQAETWTNIWAYLTIPSVREVLVLRSTSIGAELLRRTADGSWPDRPTTITEGVLTLESIGFQVELAALYQRTQLARG
jgi:Uma2 family endonuclease